jgi:hypothetical protein
MNGFDRNYACNSQAPVYYTTQKLSYCKEEAVNEPSDYMRIDQGKQSATFFRNDAVMTEDSGQSEEADISHYVF